MFTNGLRFRTPLSTTVAVGFFANKLSSARFVSCGTIEIIEMKAKRSGLGVTIKVHKEGRQSRFHRTARALFEIG